MLTTLGKKNGVNQPSDPTHHLVRSVKKAKYGSYSLSTELPFGLDDTISMQIEITKVKHI